MAVRIILDLDVENPEEVIKAHKGQLMGLLTGVVMNKESKKRKINLAVAQEIAAIVSQELPKELEKELVKAKFTIKIEENIEMI